MLRSTCRLTLLLFAATSGCNARTAAPPSAAVNATPGVQMAAGPGCGGTVANYRAVAKSDADTGNVGPSVYAQMDREIAAAENACAAGRDAEALRLVAASKSRHGYPAGN